MTVLSPDLSGLRVAIVNWRDPWHPDAGGAERYAWEMGRGLAARGAEVRFLTARAPGQSRRDCRDGIPFFTPCVLPRRVPVLCVVHHVHTAQFSVHFPRWLAWTGRMLEGPAARAAYRRHACVAVSPSTV